MSGRVAKRLRKMAREEMAVDQQMYAAPERELVIANIKGHDRVINNPLTVRGMEIQLKKAYKKMRKGAQ